MVDREFLARLEDEIHGAFKRLQTPFLLSKQDNSFVEQLAFMKNKRSMYCYVLKVDRTGKHRGINLVFRFKTTTLADIRDWFTSRNTDDSLALAWRKRFKTVWSEESGTPSIAREPGVVTSQYGIGLTHDDVGHEEFNNALDTYTRIAVEAVSVAALRKNRDWQAYNELIGEGP